MITDFIIQHRQAFGLFLAGLVVGWVFGAWYVASSHEKKMQEEILGLVKGRFEGTPSRDRSSLRSAPSLSESRSQEQTREPRALQKEERRPGSLSEASSSFRNRFEERQRAFDRRWKEGQKSFKKSQEAFDREISKPLSVKKLSSGE